MHKGIFTAFYIKKKLWLFSPIYSFQIFVSTLDLDERKENK